MPRAVWPLRPLKMVSSMIYKHRLVALLLWWGLIGASGCQPPASSPPSPDSESMRIKIDKEEALSIARKDAEKAYRNLNRYEVLAEPNGNNWLISYRPKDTSLVGGGPQYVISGETGEILSRRYEQ